MILSRLSEYLRTKRYDPDFHLVGSGEEFLEMEPSSPGDFGVLRSTVVEGDGRFFVKSVSPPDGPISGFTHFLDGVQKSRVVGYQGVVPLVYGYTAAVVRERGPNRRLSVWREAVVDEAIYAPEEEIDADGLREAGIPVRDTSRNLAPDGENPSTRYRQAAQAGVHRARNDAEAQLARLWVQECPNDDCWLFIDGGLTFAAQHPCVVGIVKSHQTQYFPAQEQLQIMRMCLGERSAMFQPGFGDAKLGDVYSWYLRLHSCEGRGPTYGLIRIEVDRQPEVIGRVDDISSWLLAERQPLAAPDPRWDKLFYPIRDCEEYLRSISPSPLMVEASLGM